VLAKKLKEEAQDLEAKIRERRDQLSKLETSRPASTFVSRSAGTLQAFGLHGKDTEWPMPIFLAQRWKLPHCWAQLWFWEVFAMRNRGLSH